MSDRALLDIPHDVPTDAAIHPDHIVEVVIDSADPDRGAPDDALRLDTLDLPAPTVPPPSQWGSVNFFINRLADAQGIEPGSALWESAGPAAYSGQSGAQASYGWRHHHKVTPSYIKAALANLGHRPCYYLRARAPFRAFPYGSAGRPIGWTPEESNDLPGGPKVYFTKSGKGIEVSGPDAEHFWVTPLLAVFDSPSIPVDNGTGKMWPSAYAAKVLLRMLASSVVGMIRDSAGGTSQRPYPWAYGGRANSRILSTILECAKRGCFEPEDAATAFLWIRDVLLPWYEKTPGIDFFNLQPIPAGFHSIGNFNGLNWCLPVFYDAMVAFQSSPTTKAIGDRFETIVKRWSQWELDLEETVPGRGFAMAQTFLPRKEFRTNGPLPSIKALITDPETQLRFDAYADAWETWSFRAASVAAKVTGSPVLSKAVDRILNRRGGDPSNKPWLVDADGEYAA